MGPVTWVATAFAFSSLGARIVFCDVDPRTLNIDPGRLEALITAKPRAIVPVHLAGQCCAMDRIMEIARRRNVAVIEDCAHNPGGSYLGRKSGALGDLGVFSFHQQKNMGTLGESGMVTTDDRALFKRVLSYRSLCYQTYGGSDKYLPIDEAKHPRGKEYGRLFFDDVGYNYRMTDARAGGDPRAAAASRSLEARIVPGFGCNLARFSVGGRAVIDFDPALILAHDFTGTPVLYPTPNRVRDCRFTWKGRVYPQRRAGRDVYEHGLAHLESKEFEAFPFPHRITLELTLTVRGIRVEYAVENRGAEELPFGFGLHPYFRKLDGGG